MDLKKLQKKWYKKLKDDGFVDIEEHESGHNRLHRWDSHYFQRRYTPDTFNAVTEYFHMMDDLYLTYDFEGNERNKRIMDLHRKGCTYSEISKEVDYSISMVRRVIVRIRADYYEIRRNKQYENTTY
jgi:uncharacterized protein YerC